MKILFIAPLPPLITGQTLASEALLDGLRMRHGVDVVNYSRGDLVPGAGSFRRIREVAGVLRDIAAAKRRADVIYFTITQSVAGNVKDLLAYLLCRDRLPRMIVHLHGGGLKSQIFDRFRVLRFLNRFFLGRMGRVVVLGESLREIFDGMVPPERIRVVPNFAADDFFAGVDVVAEKFRSTRPLKVLFLSNLLDGKGHEELVEAYRRLDRIAKERLRVDFAGGFESEAHRERFLARISGETHLRYHGMATGEEKKALLAEAHILCLPTYYRYEGQPIAILEAYASGCAVITTDHAGIGDVFTAGENGFQVDKGSVPSLMTALERAAREAETLAAMAMRNREIASAKYRKETFCRSVLGLVEEVAKTPRGAGAPA